MSNTGIASLPEDVLRDILHPVARDYLQQEAGLKQCCKLTEVFPCLSTSPLPQACLGCITQKGVPWEGIKWLLTRQPSVYSLRISILRNRPKTEPEYTRGSLGLMQQNDVHTWTGVVKQIQEECNEEVEAFVEASDDKRGHRSLVIRLYPLYEDDAVPEGPIVQHLQPLVHKLLQHGVADLQCLCVNADIIPRPELLGKLPLRHLEIRIGRRSRAQLKDIMAALGQCTTLEHLFISARGLYTVSLPDLCLYKASYLKNVILQACFPEGRLCLPPGCQLRLDVEGNFSCWEHKWQSENGRELLGCIPALCMGSRYSYGDPYHMKVLSHFHHFKVLQYLQLMNMPELTDLAMLQGIPHINVRLSHCQSSLLHSAGSWESLQIESYSGYGINFANIEAFVRDNPKYLLETDKAAKEWRSMRSALEAASKKLGVACFTNKSGSYYKRISTSRSLAESTTISLRCRESWPLANHLVNVDDFWPKQSHLASIAPIPKTDVLGCKCRLSNQVATEQSIGQEGHACQMVSWGCLLVIACILLFCMVVLAIVGGYLYLE